VSLRLRVPLDAPCPPSVLFTEVADLGSYPEWLSIVPVAAPLDDDADGRPAWQVDLRARLGPLARSKRLRMVRTIHDPDRVVQFERSELDGREHGRWVLRAEVTPSDDGSHLEMALTYEGRFGVAVLDRLLRDEIEQSRPRLLARCARS
jgi:hypothetical protein